MTPGAPFIRTFLVCQHQIFCECGWMMQHFQESCQHQAFPLSIPGWDKLRAWSALQWNKSSLFCSWCDFNSPPVEFTPLHTPRLKPIHHLSLQNRIRGFKKHRSFAFSIQFLKWFFFFFFCINGREHCSHVSQGFGEYSSTSGNEQPPQSWAAKYCLL